MIDEKLNILKRESQNRKVKIMIMGLGSVGMYLLDYLMSDRDSEIEICVVGRNKEKMLSDVNIIRVSTLIRSRNRCEVKIFGDVDFNDISAISSCLERYQPDIIVNSSRAYSGLKYGSISWKYIRAYGIWAPLAVRYIKNIMLACEQSGCHAIVVNTSYSDAVIPWLKSAGLPYPDFGSGNLNHLIPRIKFAVARKFSIKDYWNIDVTFATSHFHDVVISKEGQTEGVKQLISIHYGGEKLTVNQDELFAECQIAMPVDGKRNMMNASSNYEIVRGILSVIREEKERVKFHSPGVFGELGGYPVIIDGAGNTVKVLIDDAEFDMDAMRQKNRESIYLDGIEDVRDGVLYYTEELRQKVRDAFGVELVKKVSCEDSERTACFLIEEIIEKYKEG